MANVKTNAVRILERMGIPCHPREYDTSDGKIDGISVAHKLNEPPETVFKTLVTQGKSGGYFVFVLPVEEELNLKKAACAAGEKSVEMIPVKSITAVTGYVRGGCSPIGMKKQYPTFLHHSAEALPAVIVSGGRIGLQLTISPQDLLRACGGALAELC